MLTRHVDMRTKFVNEMVADGFLKIIFVKSEENVSDGFTKNVSGDIYEAHKNHYLSDKASL